MVITYSSTLFKIFSYIELLEIGFTPHMEVKMVQHCTSCGQTSPLNHKKKKLLKGITVAFYLLKSLLFHFPHYYIRLEIFCPIYQPENTRLYIQLYSMYNSVPPFVHTVEDLSSLAKR